VKKCSRPHGSAATFGAVAMSDRAVRHAEHDRLASGTASALAGAIAADICLIGHALGTLVARHFGSFGCLSTLYIFDMLLTWIHEDPNLLRNLAEYHEFSVTRTPARNYAQRLALATSHAILMQKVRSEF
jgi:hypothetical protein